MSERPDLRLVPKPVSRQDLRRTRRRDVVVYRPPNADNPIHLSPDAAAAFTEALNRPAQVNDRLMTALQRPTKFSWLD